MLQCLQVCRFIRILYEIIAANTENKIENTAKFASVACVHVLAAILYRTKHKIRICTPKVLKFWVEITDLRDSMLEALMLLVQCRTAT